jgi:hypothetical protein
MCEIIGNTIDISVNKNISGYMMCVCQQKRRRNDDASNFNV